jgi:hypothetical protein
MSETTTVIIAVGAAAVFAALAVILASRRTSGVRDMLAAVATSAGWSDLRSSFVFASGVKATWRSFPVDLAYLPAQKGVPQRLRTRIRAQSDALLTIKRRFPGVFSNKPIAWFGPPLIDVHHPAAAELWVRGDAALAERLFGDTSLMSMISSNVVARFDEIRIDRRGLSVLRSLDDRNVRELYGLRKFQWTPDPEQFEPIAREEIALAQSLSQKLMSF